LPYYCLGHIGYEVVEWKRNQGLATLALKSMCEIAKKMDMSFVEVVTDIENSKSQRVIVKSNGVLTELFVKPKHFGQTFSIRYRIYL
jgi:predicted acetyltransferase